MKIRIECWAHDVKPVTSAERELHWIPTQFAPREEGELTWGLATEYQLDEGNLYCTGGAGEHQFYVQLDFETGTTVTTPLFTT